MVQSLEDAVHQFASLAGVLSVRNLGLTSGIDLAVSDGQPGRCGVPVQAEAFDRGLLTRAPGDTLMLAPSFVCTPDSIRDTLDRLASAIQACVC